MVSLLARTRAGEGWGLGLDPWACCPGPSSCPTLGPCRADDTRLLCAWEVPPRATLGLSPPSCALGG